MRIHLSTIGLLLIVIMLSASVLAQDKTDAGEKNATTNNDEFLKNPLTKEEGKKIFDSLSDEKKKEIVQRWEELKKLPEDQRKKALENFYRLLNAEFKNFQDNSKKDEVKNDVKKSNNIPPEIFLANILHIAHFNIIRGRSIKHMQLLRTIQRDDPDFFYNLSSLSKEEQIKKLIEKRDELFEKEIDAIARKIKLDEKTSAELKKLLKKQREEEDKAEIKFIEKQALIWEQTYNKIKANKELFEPLIQFITIFETMKERFPGNGGSNRQRRGNPPRGIKIEGFKSFWKPCNLEIWNSSVEKLNLSKNKTEKLINGYKVIFEKYDKDKEFQKHRQSYQDEVNALIEKTISKEQANQLLKYIVDELMSGFKGRNRKGFRNK